MKAIVADDSMFIRRIISKIITPLGYELAEAANGQDVLDILDKDWQSIDLILMDWNMPTMDGFEALQAIKGDQRFSSIPVIMLTSESDEKRINMAYEVGANGYLEKPFTPDELIAHIEKVMG